MTKKTIYGGLIILIVFTLLVAVGIFLMQRYNGIANAEGKIKENVVHIDATTQDEKTQAQELLDATQSLKDKTEYTNLTIKKVSLENSSTAFFKDDESFQKSLSAYLDLVASDNTLSKDDKVSTILGQIQSDQVDLRAEKVSYNAAVDTYNTKRNARPQFYSQLLGFQDYQKFTNIPAPLDSTPTQNDNQNQQDQNQTPDINSFN